MSRKRFTALVVVASTLAACTVSPATYSAPSTQLGTVAPDYPVGTELSDGVEVLKEIPTAKLSTAEPMPFDGKKTCAANVPPEVVTPADVTPTPVLSDAFGCVWHGSGHGLEIGALTHPMAKEVEEHIAMAYGKSGDQLDHLAWLRIDGHYAIERILKTDRTKGCWLSLDLSSTVIAHVVMYAVNSAGEPVKSDTKTSVTTFCPITRRVAIKLLDHLDGDAPAWWETVIHPTG